MHVLVEEQAAQTIAGLQLSLLSPFPSVSTDRTAYKSFSVEQACVLLATKQPESSPPQNMMFFSKRRKDQEERSREANLSRKQKNLLREKLRVNTGFGGRKPC